MASNLLIPPELEADMLTDAAESYMPSLFFWRLDGLDEQKWWDALAVQRLLLEATHPRDWPRDELDA